MGESNNVCALLVNKDGNNPPPPHFFSGKEKKKNLYFFHLLLLCVPRAQTEMVGVRGTHSCLFDYFMLRLCSGRFKSELTQSVQPGTSQEALIEIGKVKRTLHSQQAPRYLLSEDEWITSQGPSHSVVIKSNQERSLHLVYYCLQEAQWQVGSPGGAKLWGDVDATPPCALPSTPLWKHWLCK